MTTFPPVSPGTVSRILWHFTGGPESDAGSGARMERIEKVVDLSIRCQQIVDSRICIAFHGAPITICSRWVLSFKPSRILKDRVNNGSPRK